MKTNRNGWLLLAASCMALLAGNAQAQINMPEREHVQTLVRIVESVTFITVVLIAGFVWRVSKRDSRNRKSKQDDNKAE